MKLAINGKFLGRPLTGVDRYAFEIATRLSRWGADRGQAIEILLPPGLELDQATQDRFAGATFRKAGIFRRALLWEQLTLPFVARDRLLLSLCNIGPVLRRKQCVMIADAQFITQTQSYSRAFATWYRLALPRLARRARALVTISDYSKRELEAFEVFPVGKAQVVPCGVDHVRSIKEDTTILDRLGVAPQQYILIIGSRARHKHVVPTLQYLQGRLPVGAKVVVAGGGNSRVFADDGLVATDDILLAGRVSDEELVALFRGARMFLFPSLTEGFGLPPGEAMALGCPVIASDRGAIPEVMGDACLYADPEDGEQWVEAVGRLWSDGDLRSSLINRGNARASYWSWDNTVNRLLKTLQNC